MALGTGPLNRFYQGADDKWFFLSLPRRRRGEARSTVDGLDRATIWKRSSSRSPPTVWVERLAQHGIPAQMRVPVDELMVDPYVSQRGLSVSQQVDGVGETTAPGLPGAAVAHADAPGRRHRAARLRRRHHPRGARAPGGVAEARKSLGSPGERSALRLVTGHAVYQFPARSPPSSMKHSTDRIRVSHAGNLPRPRYLDELIEGGKNRDGSNTGEYHSRLPKGVQEIVDRQIELGVDIVNDGEYAKAGSYGGYMQERVERLLERAGRSRTASRSALARPNATAALFPGFYASGLWFSGSGGPIRPGFATPGEVRQYQPARDARLHRARQVHRPGGGRRRHQEPEGRARGQGRRRGLRRRARSAQPGRGRQQRVLPAAKRSTCRPSPRPATRSTRPSPTPG